MKSPMLIITFSIFCLYKASLAQGLFEKWPMLTENCVHIFGAEMINGQLSLVSAGTGATFIVPSNDKDEFYGVMSIITARHNLMKDDQRTYHSSVVIKMRSKDTANRACFIQVPLQTQGQKNFWESPSGLDVAVIPLPPELVGVAQFPSFKESNILTLELAEKHGVSPGLLTYSACHQPGYITQFDLTQPTAQPIIRIGHLSRLGWRRLSDGTVSTRPHVLDAHTSPGNSGATVVINVVTDDSKVRFPYLLGVIQGYVEEAGSYEAFEAPIKTPDKRITLTTADNSITNSVAVTIKTKANPDLTNVIPVNEAVGLRNRQEWTRAIITMTSLKDRYIVSYGPIVK